MHLRPFVPRLILVMVLASSGLYGADAPLVWYYKDGGCPVIAISADGQYIATCGYGREDGPVVQLFRRQRPQPVWRFPTRDTIWSVAISQDGTFLAAAENRGSAGILYFFHKEKPEPLWILPDLPRIERIALSGDGQYLAAAGGSQVLLFQSADGRPILTYETGGLVRDIALSADGAYLAATGGAQGGLYAFSREQAEPLWTYATKGRLGAVAISAQGGYIVAVGNGQAYLFHISEGQPRRRYPAPGGKIALSADGAYLAIGSSEVSVDGNVHLFDNLKGERLWSYLARPAVWGVAMAAGGGYLASSSGPDDEGPADINFFSIESGMPLWTYRVWNTPSFAAAVSVSADGQYVAVSEMYGVHLLGAP